MARAEPVNGSAGRIGESVLTALNGRSRFAESSDGALSPQQSTAAGRISRASESGPWVGGDGGSVHLRRLSEYDNIGT